MSGQPSGEHCSSPGVDCNTKRCLQIKADDSWNDEKCTDWNQYYCYARPACYTCTAGGNDCGKWRTQRTCTTSQDSTCVNCAGQCAAREEPAATGCTCSSCAAGQTYKAGLSSVAVAGGPQMPTLRETGSCGKQEGEKTVPPSWLHVWGIWRVESTTKVTD